MNTQEMNTTKRSDIYNIDPRNVVVIEGFNSRKNFGDIEKLSKQIEKEGILNPITVIPFKDDNGVEKYRLVDGERRLRATLIAIERGVDIMRIRANFIPKNTKESDLLTQQYLRNEGKKFNVVEDAHHFNKMLKYGYTQSEIAEKLGVEQSVISKTLQIFDLPLAVQEKIENEEISFDAVMVILKKLDNVDEIEIIVNDAIEDAKIKGKTKATVKNIQSPEIKDKNDSKIIMKGLELLINKFVDLNINTFDAITILADLKNGKTIGEILNETYIYVPQQNMELKNQI